MGWLKNQINADTAAKSHKEDAKDALAASRVARKVGAEKTADAWRREAAEENAAARKAAKEGR